MTRTALLLTLLAVAAPISGQQTRDPRSAGGGTCRANPYNCFDVPNPLRPPDTVWLEEMTWMDVRDAMESGQTTIIVPPGGIEPNGPWHKRRLMDSRVEHGDLTRIGHAVDGAGRGCVRDSV